MRRPRARSRQSVAAASAILSRFRRNSNECQDDPLLCCHAMLVPRNECLLRRPVWRSDHFARGDPSGTRSAPSKVRVWRVYAMPVHVVPDTPAFVLGSIVRLVSSEAFCIQTRARRPRLGRPVQRDVLTHPPTQVCAMLFAVQRQRRVRAGARYYCCLPRRLDERRLTRCSLFHPLRDRTGRLNGTHPLCRVPAPRRVSSGSC